MITKITRRTANQIIQEMDRDWTCGAEGLIQEIQVFHIHKNGKCHKRFRFHLQDGAILCSKADWNKYNNEDPHAVMIKSLHQLTDRKL
tara:strand:- start:1576 stop:1839 length:264 start_codon:yes stop_codon:yes gene_type:complete